MAGPIHLRFSRGIDVDENTKACFGSIEPPPCRRRFVGRIGFDRAVERAEGDGPGACGADSPIVAKDPLRITKLETLLVKPRWLFLKVHTNAGIVGLGSRSSRGGRRLSRPR